MTPFKVEITKNEEIIKLLFHKYDKITSKRQYITSILLFYSLDKHSEYWI